MTTTPPHLLPRGRTGAGRRLVARRLALVAVLGLGAATLVGPESPTAIPPAGAAPSAQVTVFRPGKGSMDADELAISGSAAAQAGPGTARSTGGEPGPAPTGWSDTFALLPGTQMVALSWDGATSGPDGPHSTRLALRSRSAGGTWTDWLEIEADPDDQGGEGAGRIGSEVIWLGSEGAELVEVRVDAGPVAELELLRMRYHEGDPVPVAAAQGQARSVASRPTIRPRSDWASGGWRSGNSGCGSGPTVASQMSHAVIHHTASTNSYSQAQVPGLIDAIYRYHTDSLGWCDVAYNFVVDKFGGIWQGRSGDVTKPVVGGHAMGFNTGSVGVTLLGQFEPGASPAAATPTSAMIDSTARILAWKLSLHGLDPKGSVTLTSGGSTRYSAGTRVTLPVINHHQQSSTTACPGANVISRMSTIRDLTAQYGAGGGGTVTPPPPQPPDDPDPTRWRPFPDVQTMTYRQYVDFLRNPGTYEDRTWWNSSMLAGEATRNALIVALLESGDLQRRTAAPARLYLAYFGRSPDHPGLRYWWSRMDAGLNIRVVSAHFAASTEFRTRYGSLSNAAFVDLVYHNVLGRAPDQVGRAFWSDRLATGRENRGGIVAQFAESDEYKRDTRASIEAVVTHDVMLQQALSTQGMRDWARMIRANRAAMINWIFDQPAYANRFR